MRCTIAIPLAALSWLPASAEDTTIEVPQGSGAFPTVGQVNCMEELGSGRFCAATYECADESGTLWGGLANHDGRRAIGVDSPVARQRHCRITVDGKAAVRWFTGFSPDGREGELVGLTARHDAKPPVVRRDVQVGGEGDGLWLTWFLAEYDIADWRMELREAICGHIKEGTVQRSRCESNEVGYAARGVYASISWVSTPFTRCVTELVVAVNENVNENPDNARRHKLYLLDGRYGWGHAGLSNMSQGLNSVSASSEISERWWWPGSNDVPAKYRECRALFDEQWDELGLGEDAVGP